MGSENQVVWQVVGVLEELGDTLKGRTVGIIAESKLLQRDIGALDLGSASEQDSQSTREDEDRHLSRSQSEASCSGKSKKGQDTRGKAQSPQDNETFCQLTASTIAGKHCVATISLLFKIIRVLRLANTARPMVCLPQNQDVPGFILQNHHM
jgi:hypothetical protein